MRLTLVLTCFLAAVPAWSSPTGAIIGFAKDSSGAFIPGVRISVVQAGTNQAYGAVTDQGGGYQFLQLTPGTYSLQAEVKGFKVLKVGSITVEVDQITRVELSLEIGEVTESVQVSAPAIPLVEPDKSTLSHVVRSQAISTMPLNARQFLDLTLLTPGVLPAAAGQSGGFVVAGARSTANMFQIDGISNVFAHQETPINSFRITDAVQEFAVQTSVALPEFGRGTGAQVNVVTKSGSNHFHGSAFEYFRNSHLDAADFFTNKLRGPKPALNRNQFGTTVGGPVLRNRTFFFFSWEGFRQVAAQVVTSRVPTPSERASVTDPISRRLLGFWPEPNASGTSNYVGNSPSGTTDRSLLGKIDHTFRPADHLSGRYIIYQGTTRGAGPTPLAGGDLSTPAAQSLSVSETHIFSPTFLNEIRAGYSRIVASTKVQDYGFNAAGIFTDASGKPLPGVIDATKDPFHSGLPTITVGGGFARLGSLDTRPSGNLGNTYELYDNMTLVSPFGLARHSWRWGIHVRREYERGDTEQYTRGSFTFTNFADFASGLMNQSTFRTGATPNYPQRDPWDAFWQDQFKLRENLTLNYGVRYEYPSVPSERRNHWTNFVPGIGPIVAGSNELLDIDPTKKGAASVVYRQAPIALSSSAGVQADKNNVAPMIGFAWSPKLAPSLFGSEGTVIRGGFRVGYDDPQNLMFTQMAGNFPFNLTTRQTAAGTQPGKFPWATGYNQDVSLISHFGSQGPGNPTVGLLPFFGVDPDLRSCYIYQFNFGIQRRVGRDFTIEADYQGSSGHKLLILTDPNQPLVIVRDASKSGTAAPNEQIYPYSQFGGVTSVKSLGNSNYHGAVLTGKYLGRRGQFFQGSYTIGKSIDDHSSSYTGGNGESQNAVDNNNRRLERGPSSYDIRHRVVIYYGLELPIGPGHRVFGWNSGLNRQVFGGWQISGITTLQTGAPFTVISAANGPDFSGFNTGGGPSIGGWAGRPDVTRNGPLPQDNRNPDGAFDPLYFRQGPAGRAGNSGRNQYYGPGLQNFDFTVNKSFALPGREGVRLQFRTDFINLFNHTNFANPTRDMSSSSFGQITQTVGTVLASSAGVTSGGIGGPRLIQFSLRLQF